MGEPEQELKDKQITTRHIRGLWSVGGGVIVAIGWMLTQSGDFATWRANEENYKVTLGLRLDTIEAHARLHSVGQHEATRKQRVKDVRQMISQLEALHVELVKLVPARRRDRVREKLRERIQILTDSLIGE